MADTQNFKDLSLEELLVLYKDCSVEAFEEFFRRTKKLVYNFLLKRLGNAADADDVFQETYFRVHKYVSSYNSEKKALVWLMFVARNAMIDRIKARQKDVNDTELTEFIAAKDNTDEQSIFKSLINELFENLAPDEVSLLADRIFNEESYDELSAKHGLTPANARQKISRILKKLREGLINS